MKVGLMSLLILFCFIQWTKQQDALNPVLLEGFVACEVARL